MSTQCNTYVILGVEIPYEKHSDQYDKYEKYMDSAFDEKREGITCLLDGMNGEYIILGHVMAKTEDWAGFNNPIVIPQDLEGYSVYNDTKRDLKDLFGITEKLKFIIVSHYR